MTLIITVHAAERILVCLYISIVAPCASTMYHSLAVAGNPGMFGSRRLLQSCNVHYPSHCQGCWIFTPCHIVEGAGFSIPVTLSRMLDFHYLSRCRGCWIFTTCHTVEGAGFSLPVTLSRVLDFPYLSHCPGCWIFPIIPITNYCICVGELGLCPSLLMKH